MVSGREREPIMTRPGHPKRAVEHVRAVERVQHDVGGTSTPTCHAESGAGMPPSMRRAAVTSGIDYGTVRVT
jgi:hypothetical protein